jgi:hypothetical protein
MECIEYRTNHIVLIPVTALDLREKGIYSGTVLNCHLWDTPESLSVHILYLHGKRFCKKGRFQCKFQDATVTGEEIIHKIVNILRYTGLLLDKKQMNQDTEEKLSEISTRLQYSPWKFIIRIKQDTNVSKWLALTVVSHAGTGCQGKRFACKSVRGVWELQLEANLFIYRRW